MIAPAVLDHLREALSALADVNYSLVCDEIDIYADELLEAEADEEYHYLLDIAWKLDAKAREYGYEFDDAALDDENWLIEPEQPEALKTREDFIVRLWAAGDGIESASHELDAAGPDHGTTKDESLELWRMIRSIEEFLERLDVLCPDVNIEPHPWMDE